MSPQTTSASSGRVLLAEDDGALIRGLDQVLTSLGYQVYCASDEPAASKMLCQARMDVVVADVGSAQVGCMDGMALLRKIRGSALELPVILMTGRPTLDTAVQAVELGAVQYLVKPFDVAALQTAIEKARSQKAGLVLPSLRAECRPVLRHCDQTIVGFETVLSPPLLAQEGASTSASLGQPMEHRHAFGRQVRSHVADKLRQSPTHSVFVDIDANDLLDETLYATHAPLTPYATHVILGIRDTRALREIDDLGRRVDRLRRLGYRIILRGANELQAVAAAQGKNLTIN